MIIKGFNHVTIRVSDLNRSVRFYQEVLGMRVVHRGRTDAYLEGGAAWVCLVESGAAHPPTGDAIGVDHVAFSVDEQDFDAAVAVLRKADVTIVRGPVQRGIGRSVNFLDPDGTQLELHTSNLRERMTVWK